MAPKPRSRAGMDAEAVARMMAAQDLNDEVEPAEAPESQTVASAPPVTQPQPSPAEPPAFDPGKVDGRSLRRTGRDPFATRIKPETHEALRRIAYTRGITIAEVLEMAVAAFDARNS